MTNRVRHRPHAKRSNPAVGVSSAGFRLPKLGANEYAGSLRGKQNSSVHNRRNVKITLPTLSILKD